MKNLILIVAMLSLISCKDKVVTPEPEPEVDMHTESEVEYPAPGKNLELADWDMVKAARLMAAASPERNYDKILVNAHPKNPDSNKAGWAMMKKRTVNVRIRGLRWSQVEVLHHELMGHMTGSVGHGTKFRRARMKSAVALGWLTQEEMDRAMAEDTKERVYQKWMKPHILDFIRDNNLVK